MTKKNNASQDETGIEWEIGMDVSAVPVQIRTIGLAVDRENNKQPTVMVQVQNPQGKLLTLGLSQQSAAELLGGLVECLKFLNGLQG